MQKLSGSAMRIGRRIGLNDEKGYMVPVFIALIVVVAVVVGYYAFFVSNQPEEYNTMYLLDSQGKAINYPEVLVADHNSTFTVNVGVVNHMNADHTYEVRTKIVKNFLLTPNGVNATAVNSYDAVIQKGATNEQTVTITENTVGTYTVVFELWRLEGDIYVFTQNYCALDIDVIS